MNLFLLLILLSNFALLSADVIWPGAIYVGSRLTFFPLIIIGFFIEWFFIKEVTKLTNKDSFKITLAMNLASTLIGIILIPIIDLGKELLMGMTEKKILGNYLGTFSFLHLLAFFIITVLINSLIETLVFRIKYKQFKTSRIFGVITVANIFSVGVVALYLIFKQR